MIFYDLYVMFTINVNFFFLLTILFNRQLKIMFENNLIYISITINVIYFICIQSVYTEQLEEMMALPKIIRTTHIKLQEETDMRVLAEGTRDKLEYEIREV